MADAKVVPYTEEELYIVPPKESKPPVPKVVVFPVHRIMPPVAPVLKTDDAVSPESGEQVPTRELPTPTFFQENKKVIIILTVVVVGVGMYWYYHRQQERKKQQNPPNNCR